MYFKFGCGKCNRRDNKIVDLNGHKNQKCPDIEVNILIIEII